MSLAGSNIPSRLHSKTLEFQSFLCLVLDIRVSKLVEAENEAILVEEENRTWYNPSKGYGLRHSLF